MAIPARTIKRLMLDLREIEADPLPTVAALPLPHDISTWHVNLRPIDGPFKDSVFHFRLKFPADYPVSPPGVEMLSTGLPGHPNVFGNPSSGSVYICLSMLKPHTAAVKYDGWTSAYSVMSLLLQLQSFLFAESGIEQDYGETEWHRHRAYNTAEWPPSTVRLVRSNNRAFRVRVDDETWHTHDSPWPPFADATTPVPEAVLRLQAASALSLKLEAELKQIDELQRLVVELEAKADRAQQGGTELSYKDMALLSFRRKALPGRITDQSDLGRRRHDVAAKLAAACAEVRARGAALACEDAAQRTRRHTMQTVRMEDLPPDVLASIADHLRTVDLPSFGRVCCALRDASKTLNLFGRRQLCCFHTKERFGAKGVVLGVGVRIELHPSGALREVSTPFDLISEAAFTLDGARLSVWKEPFTHFLPVAIHSAHFGQAVPFLQRVTKQIFGETAKTTHLLDLLSSLMNSMVVHLFTAHGAADRGAPPLHASEVALDGYCAFHHLLLSCAARWPDIRVEADRRVATFLSSESARHKERTADLGRLLIALTLSSKGWDSLSSAFVREMLTRNVRWVLQKKPFLESPHGTSPAERARHTFDASLTSLRLVAFQIFFLNLIGRPAGVTGPEEVLAGYERRLGRPTSTQRHQLQAMAKRTLQLSSWREFFTLVVGHRHIPDSHELHAQLVEAVASSARKGYHRQRGTRHGGPRSSFR